MSHVIKKQIIELNLDSRLNHFSVQHRVSEHFWAHIVPLLENLFDTVGNEGEVIEIDRLEIDLGVITAHRLEENNWSSGLEEKLEKILREMAMQSRRAPDVGVAAIPGVFRQWIYYMQHGYLPWNTVRVDMDWYREVLEILAVDMESIRSLRTLIWHNPTALKRVIAQHDETFLCHLTEVLMARKEDRLPQAIRELVIWVGFLQEKEIRARIPDTEKEVRMRFWKMALQFAGAPDQKTTAMPLTEQLILSELQEQLDLVRQPALRLLPASLAARLPLTAPLIRKYLEALGRDAAPDQIDTLLPKTPGDAAADKISTLFPKNAKKEPENAPSPGAAGEDPRETAEPRQPASTHVDEEGIFVANAGVVLLHPFLPTLFTRLQLLQDGRFPDSNRHQQALSLVHYLATGLTTAAEHELVVPKVLCGYDLAEPVDAEIALSAEALGEADQLLLAAIQQWEKIGDTSPAGLREGFLQRSGKLYSRNGSPYLRIESSAIDILLDYLPWGLSMIILPWTKEMLRIEWR